jgi:putative hydrolase of the HAD superfamily
MTQFRTLFLDLDDTLYPSSAGLWDAIAARILAYMSDRFGIPAEEAQALRREYFQKYGTTFNGLRIHHQADAEDYMAYVHDLPLEQYIKPAPELRTMLATLPQNRVIFTNASRDYVERVLACLGIREVIDQIVDIFALALVNKPALESYERAMSLARESDPAACILVDDLVRNLLPAAQLGMTTVLVGENHADPAVHYRVRTVTELPQVVPELLMPLGGGSMRRS